MKSCEVKILYVNANPVGKTSLIRSGGFKGMQIFEDALKANFNITVINAKKGDSLGLIMTLRDRNLAEYSHAFFHYTDFWLAACWMAVTQPKLKLVFRSHNAEFWHWIDHAICSLIIKRPTGIKHIITAFRKAFGEFVCGLVAHRIATITPWEKQFYWHRFVNKSKVFTVPYFEPNQNSMPIPQKHRIIVLVSSPNYSAFSTDMVINFDKLVGKLGAGYPDWKFVVTGERDTSPDLTSERVSFIGLVDDLEDILISAKAVAMPTNFGYGFKTRILEALNYGCTPIVNKLQFERLPKNIQKHCYCLDPKDPKSFEDCLIHLQNSQDPPSDVNKNNKAIFHRTVRKLFVG